AVRLRRHADPRRAEPVGVGRGAGDGRGAAGQLLPRPAGGVAAAGPVRPAGGAAAGDAGLPGRDRRRPGGRPRTERRCRPLARPGRPRVSGRLGVGLRRPGAGEARRAGGAVVPPERRRLAPVPPLRPGGRRRQRPPRPATAARASHPAPALTSISPEASVRSGRGHPPPRCWRARIPPPPRTHPPPPPPPPRGPATPPTTPQPRF